MIKRILASTLAASLSFSLFACSTEQGTIGTPDGVQQAQNTGTLTGVIYLPGQLMVPPQIASSFNVLEYFVGSAAVAEEDEDNTLDLSEDDVRNMMATVNGKLVELKVEEVRQNPESGETQVKYEIPNAPDEEGKEKVEIHTPEGTTILGGMADVKKNEKAEQDIDVESTAVLAKAEEIHGKDKVNSLSTEELEALELDPDVLNMKASLRSILKKDGSLKANAGKRIFGGDAPAAVGKAVAEKAKAGEQAEAAKNKGQRPDDAGAESDDAAESAAENADAAEDKRPEDAGKPEKAGKPAADEG